MSNNIIHKIKISIIDTTDGKKTYKTKTSSSDNSFSQKSIKNIPTNQPNKRKFDEKLPSKINPKSIKNRKNNSKLPQKNNLTPKDPGVVIILKDFIHQHAQEITRSRQQALSKAHDYFKQKNYEAAFAEYIVLYFRLRDFDERDHDRSFPSLKIQALEGAVLSYYETHHEITQSSQSIDKNLQKKPVSNPFLKLEISYLINLFFAPEDHNELSEDTKEKIEYIQKIIEEAESILAYPSPNIQRTNNLETTKEITNTNRDF